jgi:Rad3-related DNA helicase
MADQDIIGRIDQLIDEERQLRSRAVGQGLSDADRDRLDQLERHLDQCWDLLRQRRARAEFDEDPEQARARPSDQVESYRQ